MRANAWELSEPMGSGKINDLKDHHRCSDSYFGGGEVDGRISALLELGAGFNMEYSGLENVYLNGTMIGFQKKR